MSENVLTSISWGSFGKGALRAPRARRFINGLVTDRDLMSILRHSCSSLTHISARP